MVGTGGLGVIVREGVPEGVPAVADAKDGCLSRLPLRLLPLCWDEEATEEAVVDGFGSRGATADDNGSE